LARQVQLERREKRHRKAAKMGTLVVCFSAKVFIRALAIARSERASRFPPRVPPWQIREYPYYPKRDPDPASWRNWQTQRIQNPSHTSQKHRKKQHILPSGPLALRNPCADDNPPDPDLAEIVAAWPTLPADVRAMLVKVVSQSARGRR
jgi:hypothetical protein